ncbi:MFS transporter [Salinicoccus halodurans]|uniref:MFS transporter n=1 Tax=Salinicoccus halodurans TaxID=407035 RepID=A0A0F7HPU4_9STAP|nr:MFS transporter [Salinicoccus halodurans]AKG75226.1 MFS transporter [Salinicoccus halodurans]SFK77882.1 Major Facilitator Superfamily protein [Salinicoccus halodurans]
MNTSLIKNRTFVLLFVASIFAVTGFSMFLTTTTWYVITDLDMPSLLGIVLIVITVPRLIMMTYGGILADNYKKSTIMFGTNSAQAVLLLCITLLVWNDAMTLMALLSFAGLFGMLDAFFGPASTSLLPKIVDRPQLQKANAYFQGVDQVSFILGPVLAGMIMEVFDVSISFFVAFILVSLSALIILPPFIKEAAVENKVKQSQVENLKEGFNYVRQSNFLLIGMLILITLNFFVFGTLHIAIPLLVDVYGGTPINLSYMEMSLSIGMVLGTLILGRYIIAKKGRMSLYGLLATVIFYIIFSFMDNLTLLPIMLLFIGFAMSFVFIPFFTAAQEITENRMMGRVMSLIFLAMNGFDPIAYALVSGLTTFGIPVQFILLGFGSIGLLITVVIFMKAKEFQKLTT